MDINHKDIRVYAHQLMLDLPEGLACSRKVGQGRDTVVPRTASSQQLYPSHVLGQLPEFDGAVSNCNSQHCTAATQQCAQRSH